MSSTCERETPREHIDMVHVRTWSFTFACEVLKKTCGMTVTGHRMWQPRDRMEIEDAYDQRYK